MFSLRGDVAQLGERSVRNAEAEGSSPFISTISLLSLVRYIALPVREACHEII